MDTSLQERVAASLLKHDPIRIYFPEHANDDEYDPEAKVIALHLRECSTEEQCVDLVYATFVEFFSQKIAGDRERYQRVAADVWALR